MPNAELKGRSRVVATPTNTFRIPHSKFRIIFWFLGWLAQLVRAPVSHTGGHRFESCAAHFPMRNDECGIDTPPSIPHSAFDLMRRVLVISHTYVQPAHRGKLRALAAQGLDVTVGVPQRWREPALGERIESAWERQSGLEVFPIPAKGGDQPDKVR